MAAPGLLPLLAALTHTEHRARAGRAVADALGVDELVVLLADPEIDAMLPAPGLRRTLPGGSAWREFLARCRVPGIHSAHLPWPPATAGVTAYCSERAALLLVGGQVAEEDAGLLLDALPLLESAFSTGQALAIARGELAAARAELVHSANVARALDDARRQVDRTLVELDAKTRALEVARERAEAAMRTKDQFLAMLGHELRNPLAPIVTALELVERRGRWSQEHDIMRRQVDHMMRLVDDLMDVTRIATGKLALDPRPVELAAVVASAIESVRPLIQSGRRLHVDVPHGLVVRADPRRIGQVFANLLTNALKYSDPDTPVAVHAHHCGDVAVIDVVDQGIGIEPAHLDSVFELFEQQGRGIDRAQGGLGLGLAIVRNIVQLHGGRVRAESRGPGQGSRFTVELAVVEGAVPSVEPPVRTGPEGGGRRVLLVDDNADALATLAMALEMSGYHVRTAADGPAALQAVAGFRPEAAVLDIGLPGMSGYDLAIALRRIAPPPLAIVALTGYGQPGDRQRAAEAGFDAHLVKPVDFGALAATLEALLEACEVSSADVD